MVAPIQAYLGIAETIPGSNVTSNAVIVELDPSGNTLFSTYLGGQNNGDKGYGVAVGSNSTVYVVGRAGSMQFPTTPGAAGKMSGDGFDTFITAVNLSSGCTFSLSQPSIFPASGATGSVTVSTQSSCDWLAISNQSWITIMGGAAGSGPGTVSYTVAPSIVPARSALLSIGGSLTNISQASGCTFSLSTNQVTVPAAGEFITVNLSTGLGCTYTASTPPSWIEQFAGPPYEGATGFVYDVTANTTGTPRSATLTLAGQPLVIDESGGFTCTFVVGPTPTSPAGGTPGSVEVATSPTCAWTVVSNASWLHVLLVASGPGDDPVFGTGSGHVNFQVDTNPGPPRKGTFTIGGQTLTITQAAMVGRVIPSSIGVFRSGQWWLDGNGDFNWTGPPDRLFYFGQTGDIPIMGDWTNTGIIRAGLFRKGQWWLDLNNDGMWDAAHDTVFDFGEAGDTPVVGDWDGSGVQRIGIFRNGQWWLDLNGDHVWDAAHDTVFFYGQAGDVPVIGDWSNSGLQRIGIFRSGQWWLDMNGDHVWDVVHDTVFYYGEAGDAPVVGDWTHSGQTRIGIFRQGQWWLDMNGDHIWDVAHDLVTYFGIATDKPVVAQ